MTKHIVKTTDGRYYTGCAGELGTPFYWLSEDRALAFEYSGPKAAKAKADNFNKWTSIHGKTFLIEEVQP